mmetsp:Transcript_34451/g.81642  ORF Transcript_34451/g.81642 Transcript_34451/m.81642 type:complete len:228 (+) Transcript_34451:610-1293(+)
MSVLHDLLLVIHKLGGLCGLEGDRQPRDRVVVRASLKGRKHCLVDPVDELLLGKDHPPTRATERLVRRGRDDVSVLKGVGADPGGHEPRDVRHVCHQVRANRVGDGAHPGIVDVPGVGGGSGNDEPGTEQRCALLEGVVVNDAGGLVKAVWHGLEVHRRCRDTLLWSLEAVSEMTAVRKVQPHNPVMWVEQRCVDGHVGRASREGLDVDPPPFRIQAVRLKRPFLAE